MSALETAGIFVGIPLLVILFFASFTLTRKNPHPATYNMNDGWTYGPVLWAAVDEQIRDGDEHDGGHGAGHDDGDEAGHTDAHGAEVIGGTASGRW